MGGGGLQTNKCKSAPPPSFFFFLCAEEKKNNALKLASKKLKYYDKVIYFHKFCDFNDPLLTN